MAKGSTTSNRAAALAGEKPVLTMELAEAMAAEALAYSWSIGRNTVTAICDDAGLLKAFRRPDGSNIGCVDFAQLKARAALRFNTSTHVHWGQWKHQPETQVALALLPDVTVEEGGAPIRSRGAVIGGIGVSGAQNRGEDVAIIAHVLKKFGLDPVEEMYVAPPAKAVAGRKRKAKA
ncbi:MAG: heme-binding protein [Alphaproteobacteria bacterium]|nr:heme-binding protein [Alphaproteobacteria bacterium]